MNAKKKETYREWLEFNHRVTNYIGAASLYLKSNYWLEKELAAQGIKDRILGHWGTVPGLNLLYALSRIIAQEYNQHTSFIAGPGHGAPAIYAQTWLEGSLGARYSQYAQSTQGAEQLMHNFSWPYRLPSHTFPGTPGSIHEGGELGYSLATAFGTVFDNPDLMTVVVVGDGEAETGALAASWQSLKFYNPIRDGFVLPIVHINGYKISNPTLFGTMSQYELEQYFKSLGYTPLWVSQYEGTDMYQETLDVFEKAYDVLLQSRREYKNGDIPTLPVILFKTKKGWTGPKQLRGQKIEDNDLAHGVPLPNPKSDPQQLAVLNHWLGSYKIGKAEVDQLISQEKELFFDFRSRLGECIFVQNRSVIPLNLAPSDFDTSSPMTALATTIAAVAKEEDNQHRLRVFSPDESESNRLNSIVETLGKQYMWPTREHDKDFSTQGGVMEILSEQVLFGWMIGYILTGRHAVMVSYEAFFTIITSQIEQYLKFRAQANALSWQVTHPSVQLIATSTLWRQDHNGYTHQNPGLIHTLLSKQHPWIIIEFPLDATMAATIFLHSCNATNGLQLTVTGKTDMPIFANNTEALDCYKKGMMIWEEYSNSTVQDADLVLIATGDYVAKEIVEAYNLLLSHIPSLKVATIYISRLSPAGFGNSEDESVQNILTTVFQKKFVYTFHGYPQSILALLPIYNTTGSHHITGYIEEGSTTTPFDMFVRNQCSRYHLVIKVLELLPNNEITDTLKNHCEDQLLKHGVYVQEHGVDMPEII